MDYGKCPCAGTYRERFVDIRFQKADGSVALTDVSQGACLQCGSRVYKADLLAVLEALMRAH